MSAMMTELMVRLFAGGALCAAAMILAGDGAKKEIVRLCCASLTIIFVLTPLKGVPLSLPEVLDGQGEVARQIEQALGQAERDRTAAAAQELSAYIESTAEDMGIRCTADVQLRADEAGGLAVERVAIVHQGGPGDTLAQLRLRIAQDCGLPAERISMTEAVIP